MTCRHRPGDPDCSSNRPSHADPTPATPDAASFEVVIGQQVGAHLVLMVRYPNCARCAYEGRKIMVFLRTSALDALKWKKVDPHFRAPNAPVIATEAPSPAARFPGSDEGWQDALTYAAAKA